MYFRMCVFVFLMILFHLLDTSQFIASERAHLDDFTLYSYLCYYMQACKKSVKHCQLQCERMHMVDLRISQQTNRHRIACELLQTHLLLSLWRSY